MWADRINLMTRSDVPIVLEHKFNYFIPKCWGNKNFGFSSQFLLLSIIPCLYSIFFVLPKTKRFSVWSFMVADESNSLPLLHLHFRNIRTNTGFLDNRSAATLSSARLYIILTLNCDKYSIIY